MKRRNIYMHYFLSHHEVLSIHTNTNVTQYSHRGKQREKMLIQSLCTIIPILKSLSKLK